MLCASDNALLGDVLALGHPFFELRYSQFDLPVNHASIPTLEKELRKQARLAIS